MADKALSFSLADFFFNDSPDVLTPPSDFQSWIEHPKIQAAMGLFGQQLLAAPRAGTEVLSSLDGSRHKVINMTSYNYLGLSTHPEVIQAAKDALDHLRAGRLRRPASVGDVRPARGVRAAAGGVQAEGRLPAVFQRAGRERRRHPGASPQGRHVRPGREVPQEPDRRRHALRGKDAVLLPQRSRLPGGDAGEVQGQARAGGLRGRLLHGRGPGQAAGNPEGVRPLQGGHLHRRSPFHAHVRPERPRRGRAFRSRARDRA